MNANEKRYNLETIDLMHDDVTRPEVVVTLKPKMATSSTSSGGNSKIIVSFNLSESSKKSPETLLDGPSTSERMSAFLMAITLRGYRAGHVSITAI